MARSDDILDRLLTLHPKIIDLSLDRMHRILEALDHPEDKLPAVIHVAGTNGKGSVIAYLRAMLEAAGKRVHVYTSPHLVRFHERIRLAGPNGSDLIDEKRLVDLLEECETANGREPITYFEITTAAALLAFAREPADYLLLEVGLGGRLDATNVVDAPALTVITSVDIDHQQYLGETIDDIAMEKAGILKPDVACILAPQRDDARAVIEDIASAKGSPLIIAGQEWQAFEQHGRLVYQDQGGLLDLPMPRLPGHHQVDNAGTAIAALRCLEPEGLTEEHIEAGLSSVEWAARLQRLGPGRLHSLVPEGAEIWLDGGHNAAAGRVVAIAMAELEERVPKRLVLICGMLNTKDAGTFLGAFQGLAECVYTVRIPGETNAINAEDLAETASKAGLQAVPMPDLRTALGACVRDHLEAPRILVCGSLYFAGHVLAEHV